jgi:hypothetical protein
MRRAEQIEDNNTPGAVVECGVLGGGTAAVMDFGPARSDRQVHLFDSWRSFPAATKEDGDATMWVGEAVGSRARVLSIAKTLKINPSRVHFHKGTFLQDISKGQN